MMKSQLLVLAFVLAYSSLPGHGHSAVDELSDIKKHLEATVATDDFEANMQEALKMLEQQSPHECASAHSLCGSLQLFTELNNVLGDMKCSAASIAVLKANDEAAGGALAKPDSESTSLDKLIKHQALKHAQLCLKEYADAREALYYDIMDNTRSDGEKFFKMIFAEIESDKKSFSAAWRAAVSGYWHLNTERFTEVTYKAIVAIRGIGSITKAFGKDGRRSVVKNELISKHEYLVKACRLVVDYSPFANWVIFDARSYMDLERQEYNKLYRYVAGVKICERFINTEQHQIEKRLVETYGGMDI